MRVGIEVGGTFTDLVVVRGNQVSVAKVPSTPDAPEVGAINAIDAAGLDLGDVTELIHGSTVATNAVLERKGALVGVLVTRGTRDLFALQRHDRSSIYDLNYRKPEPLVKRSRVFEVDERIGADGRVVTAIDAATMSARISEFLASAPFEAVAICLLNSYIEPAHEHQVRELVAAIAPGLPITCSCDVAPEFREYERACTTVLAAYVQPTIDGYLTRLEQIIHDRGFRGHFSVMQSNGGRVPAKTMARNAVAALYSGPAAGVVGAVGAAMSAGLGNIITLDMGGTSTDVSLIVEGAVQMASQTRIDGLPVRTPVIDIATVGAGGGSIAWVDDGGLLRVGPQSAGALPGPASYGRGGRQPTVTDAHLIRGSLQAKSFLGGTMAVDVDAAHRVFEPLAAQLELSLPEMADATIRVAEANIVRAIQQVSTERGHDPRDFVLVPFGGAGGLHAARVAQELGIRKILVPNFAGVLSAQGLLVSDYIVYRSQSERVLLNDASSEKIQSIVATLRAHAGEFLRSQGVSAALSFETTLEMRYVGQAFEVSVPFTDSDATLTLERISTAFSDAHRRVFEFSKPPEKPVEIVTFRVAARAVSDRSPRLPLDNDDRGPAGADSPTQVAIIDLTEAGRVHRCQLRSRKNIPGNNKQANEQALDGPILIEDGTSTVYVPPGWSVQRDDAGNLLMQYEA
ncbi:MAG: hydantoinase/oxoprolinase family protein [Burkholderiaceae bacterium]